MTTLMGEEGDNYMGNPLHKFFKRLFTGTQKKENEGTEEGQIIKQEDLKEEAQVEKVTQEEKSTQVKETEKVEESDSEVTQDEVKEATTQDEMREATQEKSASEDITLEFKEEAGLIDRSLGEYIPSKVYEEKLIKVLQEQDIVMTSQISSGVVAFMMDFAGMTESKAKNFLQKFKGYVPFKAVATLFEEEEWYALDNSLDWQIGIEIQMVYKEIAIKEIFKGSYFEPLCKLAKIKEISKIGEITPAFLVSYKKYTGVGEKKYKKTLEMLARYAVKDSSFEVLGIMQEAEAGADYEICIEPHLYELFSKYSLGQVGMLYGEIIADGIKNMKLKNLQGKYINEVSGLINRPLLEKGLAQISGITVPSLAFEAFDNQPGLEVLKRRFVEKCSLEETADLMGLTLKDVSKLQMGTLEALTEILRSSKFVEILMYINKGDHHIDFKVLEDMLGEKNQYILELIKHNAFHDLGYNPILNMVFLHEEVGEEMLIERLTEVLPELFVLKEYKAKIEEAIQDMGIKKWGKDVIPNLLKAMGYTLNGKVYSKMNLSSEYILDMIFRHKVKKPMYLDEDAVEFLVEEAQKEYNYSLGNNVVTIEGIIKGIDEILQVGSNVYLHSSKLKCKTEIVKELEHYLVALSGRQNKVSINEVYNTFKEKLKGSSIKDQYGLYHIIFYYFGAYYKKDSEGSLDIILREERQEDCQVIRLEKVAPRLQQLINKHMDRGYIKTQVFLDEILVEEGLQEFVECNKLDNCKIVSEVLKLVDDTLLGENEFLYRVDSLYKSLEEVEAVEA